MIHCYVLGHRSKLFYKHGLSVQFNLSHRSCFSTTEMAKLALPTPISDLSRVTRGPRSPAVEIRGGACAARAHRAGPERYRLTACVGGVADFGPWPNQITHHARAIERAAMDFTAWTIAIYIWARPGVRKTQLKIHLNCTYRLYSVGKPDYSLYMYGRSEYLKHQAINLKTSAMIRSKQRNFKYSWPPRSMMTYV